MSSYDEIAEHYDAWIGPHDADVAFYVDQARRSGGPVVELGVGTGRIAIPIARAGIRVIGVDASPRMLEICRSHAQDAGVADRIDLRVGDFRRPPVHEAVPLVICPLRSFAHLETDDDRSTALSAIRTILRPNGRFAFDVVAPSGDAYERPDTDWVERGPNVWQKDEFDWERRVMNIRLRAGDVTKRLRFSWITRDEWHALFEAAGLSVHACYGAYDLRPCGESSYSIWIVTRT